MTPVLLSSLVLDSQGIPLVYQGRLRRQYTVELLDIHACVVQALQSGLHDTMTHLIDNWQHGFRYALRTNANEHEVGAYYISLLQQILRDPISDEPLDENAVLGSDGNTYSPISLNVFFLSLPDIYRNRSPLELEFENPEPFMTYPHPHPVISHLVGWLRRHGALQHSDAPRQILEELLPAVNELTSEARQARVRQVVVDTTQANLSEARRRHQQTQDLNQRIDHLFSSFRTELGQMVQPLQQQTQQFEQGSAAQIHALAHRDTAQSNQLQRRVVQMGVQDNQALAAWGFLPNPN